MIKEELNNLKSVDINSLMLFALYKIKNIPEYSAISELAYVLDKDSMLNLCEYFGGTTIRIPTVKELKDIVVALLMYQYVNIDKMKYEDALNLIGMESYELRDLKSNYFEICKVLDNYEFKQREQFKA